MSESIIKKIKTIQVTRNVEKEVLVKKIFKEKVDIELTDLLEDEIHQLDKETAHAVAVAFRKLYLEYKQISVEQNDILSSLNQEPPLSPQATEVETNTNVSNEDSKATENNPRDGNAGGSGHSGVVGANHGESSKYHYTYWNSKRKKWMNNFANDVFDDEILCAISADNWLRENDTKNRPFNADEFAEVMEHGGSK